MSKQITITFQASQELHGWLSAQAARYEQPLGGYIRGMLSHRRNQESGPVMEAEDAIPRPDFSRGTVRQPAQLASGGRILTVSEAKRRAKGKAAR